MGGEGGFFSARWRMLTSLRVENREGVRGGDGCPLEGCGGFSETLRVGGEAD